MKALNVEPFDIAEALTDEATKIEFLRRTATTGNPVEMAAALAAVARASGINKTECDRLANEKNPTIASAAALANALGLQFTFEKQAAA